MTLATLDALSVAPNHCRIQAWAWSTIVHGICIGLALFLITDFQPTSQSAPLRLDIASIQTAPPKVHNLSNPQERPNPTPVHNSVVPEKMVSPTPLERTVTTKQPVIEELRPSPEITTQVVHHSETPETSPPHQTQDPVQTTPKPVSTKEPVIEHRPSQEIQAQEVHHSEIAKISTPQHTQVSVQTTPVLESTPTEQEVALEPVTQIFAQSAHSKIIEQAKPVAQEEPRLAQRTEPSRRSLAPPLTKTAPLESARESIPVNRPKDSMKPKPTQTNYRVVESIMPVANDENIVQERPAPQIHHRTAVVERSLQAYPEADADYGWLAQAIWGEVEKYKQYPRKARQQEWEGKVVLEAIIRLDGTILNLRVAETSGHEILDEDALNLLWKLSPLTLKHSLGRPQLTILVPLTYKLDG